MNNMSIDKGTGGSVYFGSPGATDISKEPFLTPIVDGQTQAEDVSMLTLGSDKIPLSPVLFSDPRANMDPNTQKKETDVDNSQTVVDVAPDGSVITKGSGTPTYKGTGSVPTELSPASYENLTNASVEIAESDVIGRNPSLMEFMKTIQDAIDKLQKQLYATQQGGSSAMMDNGIQASAFVTAFLTAAKADPKMADLILLRAQLESIKIDQIGTVGSKTSIDMTPKQSVIQLLQKYGISEPPSGWSNVSIADISKLISDVDQGVTACAQALGVVGKTLESVLGASIFGFLPLVERGSAVFEILHFRNALLQAGFTGTDAQKDQAVLNNNPDFVSGLRKWRALPNTSTFTAEDLSKALTQIERVANVFAETTTVTTNDVLYMRAPGSYDLEVKAAQNFLDSMGPVNEQINNMMGGDAGDELNSSNMSSAAKERIRGVVAGLLGQSLLETAVNPEGGNTPVNFLEQAISGLMASGVGSRLSRIFLADPPSAVVDIATAETVLRYKGKKHTGKLSNMEQSIVDAFDRYTKKKGDRGSYYYDDRFYNHTLPLAIKNLSNVNLAHIPEIYDFLRYNPEIVKQYPNCKQILAEEPRDVKYPQKALGRNPDDIDPSDIKKSRQYEGEKHQWPLTDEEKTIVDSLEWYRKKYPMYPSYSYMGGGYYDDSRAEKRFEKAMNDLPNIDLSRIPEIYDFLHDNPKVVEKYPQCKNILKLEPIVVKNTQTEDEMIQAAIKMLQKILANLTSGGAKVDLSKLTSSLSDTMGLTQTGTQSFLSNQIM